MLEAPQPQRLLCARLNFVLIVPSYTQNDSMGPFASACACSRACMRVNRSVPVGVRPSLAGPGEPKDLSQGLGSWQQSVELSFARLRFGW